MEVVTCLGGKIQITPSEQSQTLDLNERRDRIGRTISSIALPLQTQSNCYYLGCNSYLADPHSIIMLMNIADSVLIECAPLCTDSEAFLAFLSARHKQLFIVT
ncbi:hypothetical protein TcasGA2_TC011334 [Tribolium castaneum]|uniref:Uncharacterized protein n=1 Tax=Tribolium castaneum TaxID=7070 RepID=D6X411_TRICA|nr:hypothetical protein TcasGA2_TC011334 [Tribolium castaneum]